MNDSIPPAPAAPVAASAELIADASIADIPVGLAAAPLDHARFVRWLRAVAPYVHAHRGATFVIGFGGELIAAGKLTALVQDLSLLHAMGIKLVLLHGSRPQVQEQLQLRGVEGHFVNGVRVTDAAALECAKEAAGEIRLDIEAAFSQGLPNTPMAHAHVRVISGNYVIARPVGIVDGVDFKHTGVVRKVDAEAIRVALMHDSIVLISPLGFSPTGEAFDLTMEDAATRVAIALKAEKLIFIVDNDGIHDHNDQLCQELSVAQAEKMRTEGEFDADAIFVLDYILRACRGGVDRAHVIPYMLDGGVLIELFTHDGVGTMLSTETIDEMREATIDDVGGILQLLAPLEDDGTLVKRPRELIEREIEHFTVLDHDGFIYGCAALYAFHESKTGEMAAFTIHPSYQGFGDGERLLKRIEARARASGLTRLFVLTTRTSHWFQKRGFTPANVEDLPIERKRLYNWQRRSQILIKNLNGAPAWPA
jgi:amino-acid N-acetyltransferase